MNLQLRLRDYQQEAIDAVLAAWQRRERPAVVLPTGSGKTVVFAHLAGAQARHGASLILVHRDELVRQTVEKVKSVNPGLSCGVVKASQNEVGAQVIVASVQTLSRENRLRALLDSTNLLGSVIVDEAHHAVAESYQSIMRAVGSFDGLPTVGFSATLARGDSKGLGGVWTNVAYSKSTEWMIQNGHLVDVKALSVHLPKLHLDEVKRAAGDLQSLSLSKAMMAANAPERVAEAYVEHAADRQGILFAPDVASAYEFAESLKDKGITAETVVGETSIEDRQLIYKRYREMDTQVITSAMVLTEGFDLPQASCAVIARPTQSAPLFIQMVGRVLRPSHATGKRDALVLDVAGVAGKLKLASLADLSETKGVTPRQGETLSEAVARVRSDNGVELNPLRLHEVSLFQESPVQWLKTRKGINFVQTRYSTFFLLRKADGMFRIGQCGAHSTKGGRYLHDNVTLEYGMAFVEQLAVDEDPSIASKTSPWRKGNRKPSESQVAYARTLGINTEGMNKRELSDALSVHVASRLLDR
jgi:superfamily II DNA or RNA helicase